MSDLTEREILDCLQTNLRLAAEHCDMLAVLPMRGPTYNLLRKELKLVEGACRQIAYCREDSRWFSVGLLMEEAHKRAGTWLRKFHPRPLFNKLANNLRIALAAAHQLETAATGTRGPILPTPQSDPTAFKKTSSGLLVPQSVQL